METMTVTLLSKKHLAKDVIECVFGHAGDINIRPGQYVLVHIGDEWRAFSVVDIPGGDSIKIVVKYVTNLRASHYIDNLLIGDEVTIQQPQGGIEISSDTNIFFVATGTGIVPCVELARHNLQSGFRRNITIVFGASDADDLFYRDELNELSDKYNNCKVVITLSRASDEWEGFKGRTIDYIEKNFDTMHDTNFYVCGRKETVALIIERLDEMGVPTYRRHFVE